MIRLPIAGLMVFLAGLAVAQEQRQAQRPQRPGFGRGEVLPADLAEKLGLNTEQKEKIAKLQADFQAQQRETQAKVREALEKARQDKDRDAFRKANEEQVKAREGLEAKVKDVLNAEQQKKFDELKQQGRPGRPGRPGARPGAAGVVIPAALQERLALTAEQKEKLAQLQKDVDAKLDSILTAEQKQRLQR